MYAAVFAIRRSSISHCAVWNISLSSGSCLSTQKTSLFFSRTETREALIIATGCFDSVFRDPGQLFPSDVSLACMRSVLSLRLATGLAHLSDELIDWTIYLVEQDDETIIPRP